MDYGTPLLVDCRKDFKTYIRSLNKPSRKAYKNAMKVYDDLFFTETAFYKPQVEEFMELWSKQTIHGDESVRWGFDINYPKDKAEAGILKVFQVDTIGMIFVEGYGEYIECHPPMYDKTKHPGLATYIWFKLIEYYSAKEIFLDLGSGDRGTWRDLIEHRKDHPRIRYKWRFVPEHVKKYPHKQPHLVIETNEWKKSLKDLKRSLLDSPKTSTS